jgi:hypothetical protein
MSHEREVVKQWLERWGDWMERHLQDFHSLPRIESAYASRMGRGGGTGGHRILCPIMPRLIWICDYHIGRLPDHEKEAINVWYVYKLKPDHTEWTGREKADALGISFGSLCMRKSRGIRRLEKVVFDHAETV